MAGDEPVRTCSAIGSRSGSRCAVGVQRGVTSSVWRQSSCLVDFLVRVVMIGARVLISARVLIGARVLLIAARSHPHPFHPCADVHTPPPPPHGHGTPSGGNQHVSCDSHCCLTRRRCEQASPSLDYSTMLFPLYQPASLSNQLNPPIQQSRQYDALLSLSTSLPQQPIESTHSTKSTVRCSSLSISQPPSATN
jgi:hypothetical protein